MKSVLVLGGGKVGKAVAELLLGCGKGAYRVTVADRDEANLREAAGALPRLKERAKFPVELATRTVDAKDLGAVRGVMKGHDYVVCMLPYQFVAGVADIANEMGTHYFDVTEDVKATDRVRALQESGKARVALVPQCGLAPGYIAIAAYDISRGFTRIDELTLRVGALPQYPTNSLKYNLTWSTAGLVNEYCEPCNVMLDGKKVKVPALEGLERFGFEGVEYEAFYTSGGVGSLVDTIIDEGRASGRTKIAYKTIRYPGHRDLMKFLLQDLRLSHEGGEPSKSGVTFNRQLAIDLMDHGIARTFQDVVVVFINCIGEKDGQRVQVNFKRAVPATQLFGRLWPAIELTTAAGVCAMVDLHRLGQLPQTGFVPQEKCTLEMFTKTVFGLAYDGPERLEAAALGR